MCRKMKELLQDVYALVRQNLGVAAKRRKGQYDMKVHEQEFHVGDEVWVFVPRKMR